MEHPKIARAKAEHIVHVVDRARRKAGGDVDEAAVVAHALHTNTRRAAALLKMARAVLAEPGGAP